MFKKLKRYYVAIIAGFILFAGITLLLYPTASQWISNYNQSQVSSSYSEKVKNQLPPPETQLEAARAYNEALQSGALVEAGENLPTSDTDGGELPGGIKPYNEQLKVGTSGLMARIKIPKIDVDLPIYHGVSDQVLLIGAGHLEGTSLPVGGDSTRTVVTGHRGLASARMFTDLDKIVKGDTFTFETFGEVLTYRVKDIQVVEPDDRQAILPVQGKDLATLVTCTPLGINSHRILVTGERVTPTPKEDVDALKEIHVGFPWWLLIWTVSIIVIVFGVKHLLVAPKPKDDEEKTGPAHAGSRASIFAAARISKYRSDLKHAKARRASKKLLKKV